MNDVEKKKKTAKKMSTLNSTVVELCLEVDKFFFRM